MSIAATLSTKQKFVIVDPCYVIKDEDYAPIIDIFFDQHSQPKIQYNGHELVIFCTAYGDGRYSSNQRACFPVDAGIIGAVPYEMCDKEEADRLVADGSAIFMEGPIHCQNENGTMHFNDLVIWTNDDDEEEDDYYEDDYDEDF